jgi:hypothetical protein
VNCDSGYLQSLCNGPAGRGADQQGADQSGPGGIGHAINFRAGAAGFFQAFIEQGSQFPDVVPGCDLGHHPTVLGMNMGL